MMARIIEATMIRRVSSTNWEWLSLLFPLTILIYGIDFSLFGCSNILLSASTIRI
jgi:hypothetical protein